MSIFAAASIEHLGEQTGPAVVHSGERELAASALKDATAELAGVPGIGHVKWWLVASSSPARGLHDTAVAEQADLSVLRLASRPLGPTAHSTLMSR